MDKFRNKYRITSARLKNWDYGTDASYYITCCTLNRICYFGDVENRKMKFSEIGRMADQLLLEIPERYEYAKLDARIVMPNHVHVIITIDKSNYNARGTDAINRVSKNENQKQRGGITANHNPMLHQNVSRIMNWYKGRVTYESRKINPDFDWQNRFYDNIIRTQPDFERIAKYIENNPHNWGE